MRFLFDIPRQWVVLSVPRLVALVRFSAKKAVIDVHRVEMASRPEHPHAGALSKQAPSFIAGRSERDATFKALLIDMYLVKVTPAQSILVMQRHRSSSEGLVVAANCHAGGSLPLSEFRTNGAIVAPVIPRTWQYAEFNQSLTDFFPLLELQETQQSPMF